jgi:hypothetical protein
MKLSEQSRRAAREAYYQTIAAQIANGSMRIFAANEELLVEIPFPEDIAISTDKGFTYHNLKEVDVQKVGDPTKFVVLSHDGVAVLEGTVGTNDSSDMMVDERYARLFPGMKFGINEFAYSRA